MSIYTNVRNVVPYTPLNSQLDLNASRIMQDIFNSVSPLHYSLSNDDFTTIQLPNKTLYALDESIGSALWFSLQKLAWRIVNGGHYRTLQRLQITSSNHSPAQFADLIRALPTIVNITNFGGRHNPLYFASSREDLQQLHYSLQEVGKQAVSWIATQEQSVGGMRYGWNNTNSIEAQPVSPVPQDPRRRRLEYPNRALITNDADSKFKNWDIIRFLAYLVLPDRTKEMVLHPELSRYAIAYPEYNVFSRSALIENGYLSNSANSRANQRLPNGTVPPHPSPATTTTEMDDAFDSDVEMIDLTGTDDENEEGLY